MKRHLLFLLVSVVLGSGITYAQKLIVEDDIYRDSEYPFSIACPKSWEKAEASIPSVRIKLVSDNGLGTANITVIPTTVAGTEKWTSAYYAEKLKERPDLIKELVKKGNPTTQIIASGTTFLNNKEAFFVKTSALYRNLDGTFDETYDLTLYQIIVLFEGTSYTLTFSALTKDYSKYYPQFEYIAASFTVWPKILPTVPSKIPSKRTRP